MAALFGCASGGGGGESRSDEPAATTTTVTAEDACVEDLDEVLVLAGEAYEDAIAAGASGYDAPARVLNAAYPYDDPRNDLLFEVLRVIAGETSVYGPEATGDKVASMVERFCRLHAEEVGYP